MLHLVPFFASRVDFESPIDHMRSLAGAGLCVVSPKSSQRHVSRTRRRMLQTAVWAMEEVKKVGRSFRQFYCASVIVQDAKDLKLCKRFFESGCKPLPLDQKFTADRCEVSTTASNVSLKDVDSD